VKILVAGIGNIFLGDDGFGPAVAARLQTRTWPDGVEVADFGIRSMDLALALTSGIDAAILVDAMARGGAPGTLYVLEPDAVAANVSIETHAMDPARVLAFASSIGTPPRYVRVVGVEPARIADDDGLCDGLSDEVTYAIATAIAMVEQLIEEARCT
jgi:hydrogenase maturation protease